MLDQYCFGGRVLVRCVLFLVRARVRVDIHDNVSELKPPREVEDDGEHENKESLEVTPAHQPPGKGGPRGRRRRRNPGASDVSAVGYLDEAINGNNDSRIYGACHDGVGCWQQVRCRVGKNVFAVPFESDKK